jgi:hypothetical protein
MMPWQQWHIAHLVQNHAETQQGLRGSQQKGYQRVAGVSMHRFDEVGMKKA